MKKYAFIAALFYMSNIIFNIILQVNTNFTIVNTFHLLCYTILVIKLLRNEHDKVFTIILGLNVAVNLIFSINALAHNIKYEQYFISAEWISILAFVASVLINIPSILLCLMSYSRIKCNEIEHPIVPAILYFVILLAEVLLYTYIENNSGGTFSYNWIDGYLSLLIGPIGIYCVGKFVQNS